MIDVVIQIDVSASDGRYEHFWKRFQMPSAPIAGMHVDLSKDLDGIGWFEVEENDIYWNFAAPAEYQIILNASAAVSYFQKYCDLFINEGWVQSEYQPATS